MHKVIILETKVSSCRDGTQEYPSDGSRPGCRLELLEIATTLAHSITTLPRPPNVSATRLLYLLLIFITFTFGQYASAQTATVLTYLTNVQQIRGLDPEEAQKGVPIR